jgi:hypothetical protein
MAKGAVLRAKRQGRLPRCESRKNALDLSNPMTPLRADEMQRRDGVESNLNGEHVMKKILVAAVLVLSAATAHAADTCNSKAVDKNGKPLAGAALTSSVNKCTKDAVAACDASAKDKNGKLLAGAAKTAYTKKCVSDAVSG